MPFLNLINEETPSSVTPEAVAALVAATEPTEVRLDEVHAGPVVSSSSEMEVELSRGEPGFAYIEEEEILLVRLEHSMRCHPTGNSEASTSIDASHVIAFRIMQEVDVQAAVISAWIETNVYFIAYPYVRQFFTEITASLGLPPVVLGYMKRDEWPLFESNSASSQSPEVESLATD